MANIVVQEETLTHGCIKETLPQSECGTFLASRSLDMTRRPWCCLYHEISQTSQGPYSKR